jgi:twinkle protein
MGKTLKDLPCHLCGSKDNLKVYLDEKGREQSQCKTPGCTSSRKVFVASNAPAVTREEARRLEHQKQELLSGTYKEIRGLTIETCKLFKYQVLELDGEEARICQYGSSQKIKKTSKKDQFWINYTRDLGFFGEETWEDGKELVIACGEEDAMSIKQVCPQFNCGSPHSGDGSLKELIEKNLEKLKSYPEVLIIVDSDASGLSLKDQLMRMIPYGWKITNFGLWKDANEALIGGDITAIEEVFTGATENIPKGIIRGKQITVESLIKSDPIGLPIVYPQWNEMARGLKRGRITLIGAGTGVGKSTILREIIYPLIKTRKYKIAHLFLEEKQTFTVNSFIAMDSGMPSYRFDELSDEEKKPYIQEYIGDYNRGNNIFYDHFGSLESLELFKLLDYLVNGCKVDILILDHISILVSGIHSSREGERKDIDILMTNLVTTIKHSNCHCLAVSHLNRPRGEEGYENGLPITLQSFRGSAALGHLSDIVIGLEANQQNPTERAKVQLKMLKNRVSGKLGYMDTPYYVESTGRMQTTDMIFKDMRNQKQIINQINKDLGLEEWK